MNSSQNKTFLEFIFSRLMRFESVMAIFALCLGAVMFNALTLNQQRNSCRRTMSYIQGDLNRYVKVSGQLPCINPPSEEASFPVSWRTRLIIGPPQGETGLPYRLNEEWNSPHNRELLMDIFRIRFRCIADHGPLTDTSYMSVRGKSTLFPNEGGVNSDTFKRSANTILFIEKLESGIHMLDPKDIDIDSAIDGITQKSDLVFKTHLGRGGTIAAFTDGGVRSISPKIDPKVLREMFESDHAVED